MSAFLVDTNVAVVANEKSEHADLTCVLACIQALREVTTQGLVLLDDANTILREYRRRLSLSGQPGMGDMFLKWVHDRQATPEFCQIIHITPTEGSEENYVEFPADERLQGFDRSDRKFVAVALASGMEPEILNAVDSDWAQYDAALQDAGLHIRYLCPQHVSPRG